MRQFHRIAFSLGIMFTTSGYSAAAALGNRFDSYRDMHEKTQYGSLFFNEGAIRAKQNKERKRFVEVTGNGNLELPSQQGYCFVFHHFDSPNGNMGVKQKYRAKISKWFKDGRLTEQLLEKNYWPTDNVVSSDVPDWCTAGIDLSKISIEFSSDDTSFNRNIVVEMK